MTSTQTYPMRMRAVAAIGLAAMMAAGGCAPRERATGMRVERAVQHHRADNAPATDNRRANRSPAGPSLASVRSTDEAPRTGKAPRTGEPGDVVAYVDGAPISRSKLVDLLIAGHGVGILEQLVALEQAKAQARRQGIRVTRSDINAEADRALARLLSPIPPADPNAPFDRAQAESLLDEVLADRNVSRDEYMLVIERNAYLRAAINANMTFTRRQLREEYARYQQPTAHVRHIQLRSRADADRVASLLDGGADFGAVARELSVNLRTGPDGGRIRPFTRDDPAIPTVIRETAFSLKPGAVSGAVPDGQWLQMVQLERIETPPPASLASLKPRLERRLRRRLVDPAMQTLFRTLFNQTDIRIVDPTLARAFHEKHPERGAAKH